MLVMSSESTGLKSQPFDLRLQPVQVWNYNCIEFLSGRRVRRQADEGGRRLLLAVEIGKACKQLEMTH